MKPLLVRIAMVLTFVTLTLGGCTTGYDPTMAPRTVENVDLKRYQGTWYELARLPMYFQNDCAQSEAHYALKPDGNVAVTNRCRTLEGDWKEITGTASPQVAGKTDKLWVQFDPWYTRLGPKGNYWVLYVSDDYQTAVVGHPDRKYLWLLSRKPRVSETVRDDLTAKARQQGYDTSRLVWRVSDSKIGK